MKTYCTACFTVVLAALFLLNPLSAAGRGADWPSDSLTRAEDLGFLSVGLTYEEQERKVEDGRHNTELLKSRHIFGTLGIDLVDWLSLTAGAGHSEVDPQGGGGYEDGDAMWTLGLKATVFEHLITDPTFLISRLRIDTSLSFWEYEADYLEHSIDWEEVRAVLAVSAEAYVEQWGADLNSYPYSVVFSAGAVFSDLDGEADLGVNLSNGPDGVVEFEEAQQWGAFLAVDVFVSHNLSISGVARLFENSSLGISTAFHF